MARGGTIGTGGGRWLSWACFIAAGTLAGCAQLGPPGENGVDAELRRIRGQGGVTLVSARPTRAVFGVLEQRVVVEPPAGYCLDEDSIEITAHAAFALVADCLVDRQAVVAQDDGKGNVVAIALPRSFPGILTISISAEGAFDPGEAGLDAFELTLSSPPGLALLGRGNGSGPGRILGSRRLGGALYVLAEEGPDGGAPFLAPRFWRAFTDIGGRLVMATVSSFSDRPVAEEAMLAFLASQMAALRKANGAAADADEIRLAGSLDSSLEIVPAGAQDVAVIRTRAAVQMSDGIDPSRAPLPPARKRGSVGSKTAAVNLSVTGTVAKTAPSPKPTGSGGGAAQAPSRAPRAPAKPG